MIDIFSLSVEEMAQNIKQGQITSVEICEKYIERINKFEKDVKAWAHFDKKILLEKAAESDEHRKSGKPVGPLHGVPIALKDIIGTVDMPTECGTSIRKGKSYSQNAEIVELLKLYGALIDNCRTLKKCYHNHQFCYLNPKKKETAVFQILFYLPSQQEVGAYVHQFLKRGHLQILFLLYEGFPNYQC